MELALSYQEKWEGALEWLKSYSESPMIADHCHSFLGLVIMLLSGTLPASSQAPLQRDLILPAFTLITWLAGFQSGIEANVGWLILGIMSL